MAGDENWVDIGSTDELSGPPLRRIKAGAISASCSLNVIKTWAANSRGTPRGIEIKTLAIVRTTAQGFNLFNEIDVRSQFCTVAHREQR